MRLASLLKGPLLASMLLTALSEPALADFEVTDTRGRRILLRDNGTWAFVGVDDGAKDKKASAMPDALSELALTSQLEEGGGCRFTVTLTNNLPYQIVSLVPTFAAHRANGVLYTTEYVHFGSLLPGNKQVRQMRFYGIGCREIARLQVLGGDRCEMGELHKHSFGEGRCLALVRVVPSDLLKFEK